MMSTQGSTPTVAQGPAPRFFERYPRFYQTSKTGMTPNRMNLRHGILIEDNAALFKGRRVLDIASHDGRWSFAALQAGASYAMGVEGREDLVNSAYDNFESYEVPRQRYDFAVGDVHAFVKELRIPFDIVLCFGFFYHTPFHIQLLNDITRLARLHILMDTVVSHSPDPVVQYSIDDVSSPMNSIDYDRRGQQKVVVGFPSIAMLNLVLGHLGYNVRYLDWHARGIQDWSEIDDYRTRKRISLLASQKRSP
jgi:hypothetical protein